MASWRASSARLARSVAAARGRSPELHEQPRGLEAKPDPLRRVLRRTRPVARAARAARAGARASRTCDASRSIASRSPGSSSRSARYSAMARSSSPRRIRARSGPPAAADRGAPGPGTRAHRRATRTSSTALGSRVLLVQAHQALDRPQRELLRRRRRARAAVAPAGFDVGPPRASEIEQLGRDRARKGPIAERVARDLGRLAEQRRSPRPWRETAGAAWRRAALRRRASADAPARRAARRSPGRARGRAGTPPRPRPGRRADRGAKLGGARVHVARSGPLAIARRRRIRQGARRLVPRAGRVRGALERLERLDRRRAERLRQIDDGARRDAPTPAASPRRAPRRSRPPRPARRRATRKYAASAPRRFVAARSRAPPPSCSTASSRAARPRRAAPSMASRYASTSPVQACAAPRRVARSRSATRSSAGAMHEGAPHRLEGEARVAGASLGDRPRPRAARRAWPRRCPPPGAGGRSARGALASRRRPAARRARRPTAAGAMGLVVGQELERRARAGVARIGRRAPARTSERQRPSAPSCSRCTSPS